MYNFNKFRKISNLMLCRYFLHLYKRCKTEKLIILNDKNFNQFNQKSFFGMKQIRYEYGTNLPVYDSILFKWTLLIPELQSSSTKHISKKSTLKEVCCRTILILPISNLSRPKILWVLVLYRKFIGTQLVSFFKYYCSYFLIQLH